MAKRAVVFDLFDTLVSGGSDRRDALLAAMAGDLGVDPVKFIEAFRSSYRERFAGDLGDVPDTVAELSRRCGVEPSAAGRDSAVRRRIAYMRDLLEPFPGIENLLSTLANEGRRLGLIVNCAVETVALWPDSTLARFFPSPVFSCEVAVCKPDPAIYRLASDAIGVGPADCLYVADGAGGELAGARDVGMATIRVLAAGADHATFGGVGDWSGPVIDDLTGLPGHLRSIEGQT